jgi:spore maturation protein CgeB
LIERILYIGDLNEYGRCFQRYRALLDLNYKVTGLSFVTEGDVPGISKAPNIFFRIANKIGYPPDETHINKKILEQTKNLKSDILWIDKGLMIHPDTLGKAKLINPTIKMCFFSEDDMFAPHNHSAYFKKCLPLYDLVFTAKAYNALPHELPKLGARRVVFIDQAYDVYAHRPMEVSQIDKDKFGADVGFIGTFEKNRAIKMLHLARNGIKVRIWGNNWASWMKKHPNLQVENQPLYGDKYSLAISATKINLCFLRKINRDLQTSRTFEIPACEGFMLAERTREHLRLFEEGKEADFFDNDNPQELLAKVQYYLAHEDKRKTIAQTGRKRCVASGYSHHDRLRYMLEQVEKLCL